VAKKKKTHPGMTYHTYTWGGEHDPIIDALKTCMQDEGLTPQQLSDESGTSMSTLYNWFDGKVKQPRHSTIKATIRALGPSYDYVIAKGNKIITNGRVKR
jgi:transcriptional regulator with XRE-family HTH domain